MSVKLKKKTNFESIHEKSNPDVRKNEGNHRISRNEWYRRSDIPQYSKLKSWHGSGWSNYSGAVPLPSYNKQTANQKSPQSSPKREETSNETWPQAYGYNSHGELSVANCFYEHFDQHMTRQDEVGYTTCRLLCAQCPSFTEPTYQESLRFTHHVTSSYHCNTIHMISPISDSGKRNEIVESETSTQQDLLDGIKELCDHDVIFGRRSSTTNHVGTQFFINLVTHYESSYMAARRNNKPAVARHIIQLIKEKGGRFVKRVKDRRAEGVEYYRWEVLSDDQAYEKTCQALRDGSTQSREMLAQKERQKHLALPIIEDHKATATKLQSGATTNSDQYLTHHFDEFDDTPIPYSPPYY